MVPSLKSYKKVLSSSFNFAFHTRPSFFFFKLQLKQKERKDGDVGDFDEWVNKLLPCNKKIYKKKHTLYFTWRVTFIGHTFDLSYLVEKNISKSNNNFVKGLV
jgi:hypothetical protein